MRQEMIEITPRHQHITLGCGRPCEVIFEQGEGHGRVELDFRDDPDDAVIRITDRGDRLAIHVEGQGRSAPGIRNRVTFHLGDTLPDLLELSLVQGCMVARGPVARRMRLKAVETDLVLRPGAFQSQGDVDLVNCTVDMALPEGCDLHFRSVGTRGVLDMSRYAGTLHRLKIIARGNLFTRRALVPRTGHRADVSIIGDDMTLVSPNECPSGQEAA